LLTAGTTLAIASDGDSPPAAELKPYTAQYVTKTRGISLKLDRKLVQKKDGSFELTNGGSKIIAGFNEVAKFHVENARIIPGSYIYQGTGLMNRRREVHFTRGAKTARSLYKDNWYDLPSSDNTFDRMSQMEEMRLQLLQDDTPGESFTVTVADGKRVKDYHLNITSGKKSSKLLWATSTPCISNACTTTRTAPQKPGWRRTGIT
jgi:hypothetical protein